MYRECLLHQMHPHIEEPGTCSSFSFMPVPFTKTLQNGYTSFWSELLSIHFASLYIIETRILSPILIATIG